MNEERGSERIPTIEESSNAIRELIALWRDQNSGGTIEIPFVEGLPLAGVTIFIMTQHSVAISESVLLLTAADKFLEAVPLIRLTMECAVTAAWLSVTPNAGNAARHEEARNRLATINSIFEDPDRLDEALLVDVVSEVTQLAEHKSEAARNFEKRCKSLAGGDKIYALYRILSGFSHAGIGLTDLYLARVPETSTNPYGLTLLDKANYPSPDASLVHQVGMLALSMKALDNIAPSHPNRQALDKIAKDFGFGLDINLAKVRP